MPMSGIRIVEVRNRSDTCNQARWRPAVRLVLPLTVQVYATFKFLSFTPWSV
jgi:hypothetical protein